MDFFFDNYLMKPEDVPLINSKRKNKYYGSMGTPNALVKEYNVKNVRRIYGQNLLGRAVSGIQWETEIIPWFPEILPDNLGRCSNLASWHTSYNELWRIGTQMKKFATHPNYMLIIDILESYKEKILEAMKDYDQKIYDKGDSFDQFKRFVLAPEHIDSSIPGEPGKKWRDADETMLKTKFKEIRGFHKHKIEHGDKWYGTGLVINPDYKVDALRYRDCREIFQKIRNLLKSYFRCLRSRTATGVWPDSQSGYVYWKKPDLKKDIYAKSIEVIKEIGGGANIRTFSEEKDKLYLDISKSSDVTYADLRSGETQWGGFFGPLVPVASSLYDVAMIPITYKGDSGLDRTPWYNEILNAAHGRLFVEEGWINPGEDWLQGSDNTAILKDLTDIFAENSLTGDKNDLQVAGLSLDERFLGWRGRKFYPLNLIRDSARHNVLWNGSGPIFMNMKTGRLIDVMSIVIRYDLLNTDSAVKLIEKVVFEFEEYYGSETYEEEMLEQSAKLAEIFSDEYDTMQVKMKRANYPQYDDTERSSFSINGGGYVLTGENDGN